MLYNIMESDFSLTENKNFVTKVTPSDCSVLSRLSYSDVSDQSHTSESDISSCHDLSLDPKLTTVDTYRNHLSETCTSKDIPNNTSHQANDVSTGSSCVFVSSESGYSGNFSTPDVCAPVYSVYAGSKPLSLILKRCSTPLKGKSDSDLEEDVINSVTKGVIDSVTKDIKLCETRTVESTTDMPPNFDKAYMCLSKSGLNTSELNSEEEVSDMKNKLRILHNPSKQSVLDFARSPSCEKPNGDVLLDTSYRGQFDLSSPNTSENALIHDKLFSSGIRHNISDLLLCEDGILDCIERTVAESPCLSKDPRIQNLVLGDAEYHLESGNDLQRNLVKTPADGTYDGECVMETSTDGGSVFMTRHSSDKLLSGLNITCSFNEDPSSGLPCAPLFSPSSDSFDAKLAENKGLENYSSFLNVDAAKGPSFLTSPFGSFYSSDKPVYKPYFELDPDRSPVANAGVNKKENKELSENVANDDASEIARNNSLMNKEVNNCRGDHLSVNGDTLPTTGNYFVTNIPNKSAVLFSGSESDKISYEPDAVSSMPINPVSTNISSDVKPFTKSNLPVLNFESDRVDGDECLKETFAKDNSLCNDEVNMRTSSKTNVNLDNTPYCKITDESPAVAETIEVSVSEGTPRNSIPDKGLSDGVKGVLSSLTPETIGVSAENTIYSEGSIAPGDHVSSYTGNSNYPENSPLLFVSDDEDSASTEICKQEEELPTVGRDAHKVISFERLRLNRLRELLTGVLPPPSVTVPQHTVLDILQLLKDNQKLMSSMPEYKDGNEGGDQNTRNFKSNLLVQDIISSDWPHVRTYHYFDIQFNNGTISEEFEDLCQKLQQRYVGCETASTCSTWFSSASASNNSSLRKRKSSGHSPGRRLSHLARRRRAFSSSNLQNNVAGKLTSTLSSQAPERRTIMMEIKKNESRRLKHSQGNKDATNHNVPHSKIVSSKRALFQSPTEMKKPALSASQSKTKLKCDVDKPKIRHSRRALFRDTPCSATETRDPVINVNGKRLRDESEDDLLNSCSLLSTQEKHSGINNGKPSDANCPSDRISFPTGLVNSNHHQAIPSCKRANKDLSANHKKKLLWAVAEALKKEGIGITHPSFRHCASSLASLCRRHLLDLIEPRSTQQDRGSTSDRMLKLATEFANSVVSRYLLKENIS